MKKLLVILIALGTYISVNAQKYAYVDTDYILDNVPAYKKAQTTLDEILSLIHI